MKARIILALALLLLGTLGAGGGALAEQTPQTAVTLYNLAPVTGTIAGNHAGAFYYLTIDYPGNGDVITLDMDFSPADPATRRGIGFNLYGSSNGVLLGTGKDDAGKGPFELLYAGERAERLLLQVFSYIDNQTLSFTLTAKGLPAAPVSPAAVPVSGSSPAPGQAPQSMSGSLVGVNGGAFARYRVTFPSTAQVTLVMSTSPMDQIIARGVGFDVYGPAGLVATGAGTSTPGVLQTTFSPLLGATYLVQAHNYIAGVTVSYSFSSSAPPLPAPAP
jgi:hypothetical protein